MELPNSTAQRTLIIRSHAWAISSPDWQPSESQLCFNVSMVRFKPLAMFSNSKLTLSQGEKDSIRIRQFELPFWSFFFRRIPADFKQAVQRLENFNEILYLGNDFPVHIQRYIEARFPMAFICQVAAKGTISRGLVLLQENNGSPAHALQQLQVWKAKCQE